MAAVSCADTQIPETTVATQSLPKIGFRKAIQLEVLDIRIEAKCYSKIQQHHDAAIAICSYKFEEEAAGNRKILLLAHRPLPSCLQRFLAALTVPRPFCKTPLVIRECDSAAR